MEKEKASQWMARLPLFEQRSEAESAAAPAVIVQRHNPERDTHDQSTEGHEHQAVVNRRIRVLL